MNIRDYVLRIKSDISALESLLNKKEEDGYFVVEAVYPSGTFFSYTRADLVQISFWRHLNNTNQLWVDIQEDALKTSVVFSGTKEECIARKIKLIDEYFGSLLNIK